MMMIILQVIEIRGGTVLFEPGAVGGSFTGVYFTSDQTDFEVRRGVVPFV